MNSQLTIADHMRNVGLLPGLIITGGLAVIAYAVHQLPGMGSFSPAILAAVGGVVLIHLVRLPEACAAGVAFSSKTLLRLAVALLGIQVSLGQIAGVGLRGFHIVALGLSISFITIRAVGRWLGVEARLAELIAAGTSICGASAVAGVNAVTQGEEEDVAYAVAMVTLFGTAAMLIYPLLDGLLGLDARHYGLWAGASIHEVAQVVGATAQVGPQASEIGAIAKLTRILLLAPLVLGLTFMRRGAKDGAAKTRQPGTVFGVPLFVIGFAALVVLGSVWNVPHVIRAGTGEVSSFLLALALGAMGMKTHISDLRAKGWAPLALGAFGAVFISLLTLGLTVFFG